MLQAKCLLSAQPRHWHGHPRGTLIHPEAVACRIQADCVKTRCEGFRRCPAEMQSSAGRLISQPDLRLCRSKIRGAQLPARSTLRSANAVVRLPFVPEEAQPDCGRDQSRMSDLE